MTGTAGRSLLARGRILAAASTLVIAPALGAVWLDGRLGPAHVIRAALAGWT
jgi:hypothetical protein